MQYQVPDVTFDADDPRGHSRGGGSCGGGDFQPDVALQPSSPSRAQEGALGSLSIGRSWLGMPPVICAARNMIENTDNTLALPQHPT